MNAEGLYRLIHSLTPAQKANFSSFLGAGKGRSSKFKLLYDRILKAKVYDEKKIRGKEFSNAARFYQNREILLDKIIQSLVFFSDQRLSMRSYVFQAMELGAFDHARRRLANELERASQDGDKDLLRYLFSLKERVEQAYRVEFKVEIDVDRQELSQLEQFISRLRELFRKVDQLLKQGWGEAGDLAAMSLQNELDQIPIECKEAAYLEMKIRSGLAIMQKDHFKAYRCQQNAVEVLERGDFPLSQQMLPREYYLLIHHALRYDHLEVAEQAVLKYSLLQETQQNLDPKLQEMWIKATIRVAYSRANSALMEKLQPAFESLGKTAKPEIYLLNSILVATTFFISDDQARTLDLIKKVRSRTKIDWPLAYWAIETLRFLVYVEQGDPELSEGIFRAAKRLANKTGVNYPKLVIRMAAKMTEADRPEQKRALFDQYQAELKGILSDPNEARALELIDLSFWFRSLATGMTRKEAFLYREGDAGTGSAIHTSRN